MVWGGGNDNSSLDAVVSQLPISYSSDYTSGSDYMNNAHDAAITAASTAWLLAQEISPSDGYKEFWFNAIDDPMTPMASDQAMNIACKKDTDKKLFSDVFTAVISDNNFNSGVDCPSFISLLYGSNDIYKKNVTVTNIEVDNTFDTLTVTTNKGLTTVPVPIRCNVSNLAMQNVVEVNKLYLQNASRAFNITKQSRGFITGGFKFNNKFYKML